MQIKIGESAKVTGSLVETIRFYEREGLLPQAERTDGNYRSTGRTTPSAWHSSESAATTT